MDELNEKEKDFTTGIGSGKRYNHGKLRYDLVHPKAHADMVEVLTYGAVKYASRNWENGLSWTSVIASLKRHLAAIEAGEDFDNGPGGSDKLHISNLACNAHFLNAFYYTFPQGDDRPKRYLKLPKIGLDIDGVLADWTGAWAKVHPELSATPASWYFDRVVGKRFNAMRDAGTLDDFYLALEPLLKPEDIPFEPHCYITSRPITSEITEQWLDKHGFPSRTVYSTGVGESKIEIAKSSGIEIFIDDSFENFVALNNAGIRTYLYTASWNKKYDVGHLRLNSLKELPFLK